MFYSVSMNMIADQVPIVRYKNNDERMGDYERVLTLIDAYDRLQSDRIDDKDQFIDAIMAVYGASVIDDEAQAPEFVKLLKKYRILDNLDPAGRIEYLKKELDETGVETVSYTHLGCASCGIFSTAFSRRCNLDLDGLAVRIISEQRRFALFHCLRCNGHLLHCIVRRCV